MNLRSPSIHARERPSNVTADAPLRDDVLQREQERFGGFKFGAAFFGWLTATGTAVLLTALVGAIGTGIGLGSGATVDDAADAAADNAGTVGIIGAIVLAAVLLISYIAGGYVAGRMARFSGVKQGIAVWIWAVVIAIVVAIATAVAGSAVGHPRESRQPAAHSGHARDLHDRGHPDRVGRRCRRADRGDPRRHARNALPPARRPRRTRGSVPSMTGSRAPR